MHKRFDTNIIGKQYKLRLALSNFSDVSKVKHKEEKENKTKKINIFTDTDQKSYILYRSMRLSQKVHYLALIHSNRYLL